VELAGCLPALILRARNLRANEPQTNKGQDDLWVGRDEPLEEICDYVQCTTVQRRTIWIGARGVRKSGGNQGNSASLTLGSANSIRVLYEPQSIIPLYLDLPWGSTGSAGTLRTSGRNPASDSLIASLTHAFLVTTSRAMRTESFFGSSLPRC
jgi:hypothetical protein